MSAIITSNQSFGNPGTVKTIDQPRPAGARSSFPLQRKASVKLGKEGLSPALLAALDDALAHRELVKVKFDEFKEEKRELAPQLADRTGSHLVTRVGNVVVLYRPKPKPEPEPKP